MNTTADFTTMFAPNVTTEAPPGGDTPMYWGFIGAGIAMLFFGSNFVPVKKFETGDGMFFQWIVCIGIWLSGIPILVLRGCPTFYPLAMLGGCLWSLGNTMVVVIIKCIGLGLGLLIWCSFNLLAGWVTGRFGMFGIHAEVPNNLIYNYVGITLCFLSAFIYIFIKSDVQSRVGESRQTHGLLDTTSETDPLLPRSHVNTVNDGRVSISDPQGETFVDRLSPKAKRIVGVVLSIISGLLYGVSFTPVIYIQDNYQPRPSQNGLDYVFAHFCGIFATSSVCFMVYCAFMKNKPRVYPEAIGPGLISGIMWAIADAAWFVANATLSEPVAFPLITTGPGIVAALWSVFVFKEIKGKRNYIILLLAFAVVITGAVFTSLSKL